MSAPTYLWFLVISGCVATTAAVILGIRRAVNRSHWSERERSETVQATGAVLGGWFALAVALALSGFYQPAVGRVPTIEFGIVLPILLGCVMIRRWPVISRLIDVVPPRWVIAIQFYRVEGVIFLILYASKLLPGVFALPAGAGDLAVGIMAAAIGLSSPDAQNPRRRIVLLWNLFGVLDLVVAVATGFLSTPSTFQRLAFDQPNELISVFPLVLIPTFLVPLAILLHIVSLMQFGRAGAHPTDRRERMPGHVHV